MSFYFSKIVFFIVQLTLLIGSTDILWAGTTINQSSLIKTNGHLTHFEDAMTVEFTNGLRCIVEVDANHEMHPLITVYVQQDMKTYLGCYFSEAKTNSALWKESDDKVVDAWLMRVIQKKHATEDWAYYRPTNLFCGPIILVNSAGCTISAKQPEILASSFYPYYFSLAEVKKHFDHSHVTYSGPPFPRPLSYPTEILAKFQVDEYFKIDRTNHYQMTIWPKIYKRSQTNDDLCERIDLPPVTIPIKWGGTP